MENFSVTNWIMQIKNLPRHFFLFISKWAVRRGWYISHLDFSHYSRLSEGSSRYSCHCCQSSKKHASVMTASCIEVSNLYCTKLIIQLQCPSPEQKTRDSGFQEWVFMCTTADAALAIPSSLICNKERETSGNQSLIISGLPSTPLQQLQCVFVTCTPPPLSHHSITQSCRWMTHKVSQSHIHSAIKNPPPSHLLHSQCHQSAWVTLRC